MDEIYQHEQAKLREILSFIQQQLQELQLIPRYQGSDLVEQLLDDQRRQTVNRLQLSEKSPYFGRLDFEEDGKQLTPLYLGKAGVEDPDSHQPIIIDWRAPVASMFYSFTGQGDRAGYVSPDGEIEGTVHLKRNLAVEEQTLKRVVDSYVRGGENLQVTDEFLLYRLGENKDHRLRDIVSTIQVEQDKIIRSERNQSLIIQGVPGSGKTTVALHRLAYLLYQYQNQVRADRIMIFAPNKMFLDYISNVLPELGIGGVKQTTFTEWVLDLLPEPMTLRNQTAREECWFETGQSTDLEREQQEILARFKGSFVFLEYLQQQLATLEREFVPQVGFAIWDEKKLTAAEIAHWFHVEYRHEPLRKRQERIFVRIKRWIEMEHRDIRNRDPRNEMKKKAMEKLRQYKNLWDRRKVTQMYVDLAQQSKMIQSFFIERKKILFDPEDLAPLLYIYNFLYGIKTEDRFDHVVIDEAQDFSPFQVFVLQDHVRGNSFTILGDLLQNIYAYKGIYDWNEFVHLFPQEQVSYFQLDRSYRSTTEIIQFANQVIHSYQGSLTPATPIFRSGEPVLVEQIRNQDRTLSVEKWIQKRSSQGMKSIAIVTRTEKAASMLSTDLLTNGVKHHLITPDRSQYAGGISVAPIYLVKGMEFDAVILVDVDSEQYPDDALTAKLLYVGCTRALHSLVVLTSDNPSPLLPIVTPGAV
ncbi:DNA helicase-2 / ATP-dependent DNA helicase PcrA [Thermoactinomyces sp. DSM 45891]|uniref:HelD family protein n=1 Tax=Thermoactinomyces sp. DSM 45891 TaxID=1761907 RepID=UPI00091D302F|nr:3'-5' exonuclease [Thermoactinomyces sp. DSM 45891]SFX49458.1 DNA helicase-2 / ATP-dependent DNA helicase PcrA [Thermoactinomyces sp. DSM 45891]